MNTMSIKNSISISTALHCRKSSGDQYYGQRERELLKKLYPGAQVEEIGDMGQFALMARESEIIARLREFIGSLNK